MSTVAAFVCKWCAGRRYNLEAANLHEEVCDKNPANGGVVDYKARAFAMLGGTRDPRKPDPLAELQLKVLVQAGKPVPATLQVQLTQIQQDHIAKGGRLCANQKCMFPLLPESIKKYCGLCENRQYWEAYHRKRAYWR